MTYHIPQNIDKNKIFIVNWSEIEGRLDPNIYKDSFKLVSRIYPNVKLSDIVDINPNTSFSNLQSEEVVSFVPMENIDERFGEIVLYERKRVKDSKGYTRFKNNDLLWAKITPCMQNGKSAIARNLINGLGCGSTEFYVIRPKSDEVLIEYIHHLLHSEKVLKSAQNYFSGAAGQQRVPVSFLNNFSTPLPPKDVQKDIITKIEAAKKQQKEKESEAQQLLEGIDKYLLDELGITLPDIGNTVKDRMFTIKRSNLEGRLDPIYYSADISTFTQCTYSERLFDLVLSFDNGFAVGRQNQVEEEKGVLQIRPTNIDNNGRLTFEKKVYVPEKEDTPFVKTGVVLFNNTNSQELVGKTAYFANEENRNVYTSNHITAIDVDKSKIIPEYLCAILNMYQRHRVFYSICTNWNNQSGIGLDLLKSLHIPLFSDNREESLRRQQQVVDKINSNYMKADECIALANLLISDVEAEVESMIIG